MIELLKNVSATGEGAAQEVEARDTLYRITVYATTHGTTVLELRDPAGNWIAIPDASSTKDDAYEVTLRAGDFIRGNITAGTPSGVYMYAKPLGRA